MAIVDADRQILLYSLLSSKEKLQISFTVIAGGTVSIFLVLSTR